MVRLAKRLDKFVETKEIKAIIENYFVTVKLVVLENAGGDDVLEC